MLGVGRHGPVGLAAGDGPGGPQEPSAAAARVDVATAGEATAPRVARPPDTERDAWVVLAATDGVGPVTFGRLLEAFGSAVGVLETARGRHGVAALIAGSAGADGAWPSLAAAGARALVQAAAEPDRILEVVRRSALEVLTLGDPAYPARLRAIDLPPPVLFLRGSPGALDRPHAVAVVGTRRPTGKGRDTAAAIAEALGAFEVTIVSGLAYGIDAAAHVAAVHVGTPTVAVIGGGHDRLYPAAHANLARSIVAGGGAVVSEFPPDTSPNRGTFPRRNRIISGLADAVVVVEAGARSGALTTAAWALEQGRGLHLVPGRLDDPAVAGCLAFLREAGPEARVVAGIAELLEDLGLVEVDGADAHGPRTPQADAVGPGLSRVERSILAELAAGRGTVDELVMATGDAPATVLGAITSLEVRGLVVDAFGRYRATRSPIGITTPGTAPADRTTAGLTRTPPERRVA